MRLDFHAAFDKALKVLFNGCRDDLQTFFPGLANCDARVQVRHVSPKECREPLHDDRVFHVMHHTSSLLPVLDEIRATVPRSYLSEVGGSVKDSKRGSRAVAIMGGRIVAELFIF